MCVWKPIGLGSVHPKAVHGHLGYLIDEGRECGSSKRIVLSVVGCLSSEQDARPPVQHMLAGRSACAYHAALRGGAPSGLRHERQNLGWVDKVVRACLEQR